MKEAGSMQILFPLGGDTGPIEHAAPSAPADPEPKLVLFPLGKDSMPLPAPTPIKQFPGQLPLFPIGGSS